MKAKSRSGNCGFAAFEDSARRLLKWTPLLRFKSRNCSNFFVVSNGGEPGGDGGISKFGTRGSVRSRRRFRMVVYGERDGLGGMSSSSRSG